MIQVDDFNLESVSENSIVTIFKASQVLNGAGSAS